MRKANLIKNWKKIDKALEAIEQLNEAGIITQADTFFSLVELKNRLEDEIEKRTKK